MKLFPSHSKIKKYTTLMFKLSLLAALLECNPLFFGYTMKKMDEAITQKCNRKKLFIYKVM